MNYAFWSWHEPKPCNVSHDSSGVIAKCKKGTFGLTKDGKYCEFCCPVCCNMCYVADPHLPTYWTIYSRARAEHLENDHQCLIRATHMGNGVYNGPYAFTLTKSPNDDLTEEDMIKAVKKLMKQKSCPVEKYAWYLEYGDPETKSHPHIHGIYETNTGGRIETKHFKRAWPIWDPSTTLGAGFRGGYHRPVKSEECYNDYIKDYGRNTVGENFGL